jgi:hypothetical protein
MRIETKGDIRHVFSPRATMRFRLKEGHNSEATMPFSLFLDHRHHHHDAFAFAGTSPSTANTAPSDFLIAGPTTLLYSSDDRQVDPDAAAIVTAGSCLMRPPNPVFYNAADWTTFEN